MNNTINTSFNIRDNKSKKSKNTDSVLIIYQKYIELFYYSYDILKKYPKCERFSLVQEIKNSLYSNLSNILYAIKSYTKQDKLKYLRNININLNILKIQIRISYKYKYISSQNYETWSTYITDICNLLGGWINSCLKK